MRVVYYVDADTGRIAQAVQSDTEQRDLPGLLQVVSNRWIDLARAEYRDGQIVEAQAP